MTGRQTMSIWIWHAPAFGAAFSVNIFSSLGPWTCTTTSTSLILCSHPGRADQTPPTEFGTCRQGIMGRWYIDTHIHKQARSKIRKTFRIFAVTSSKPPKKQKQIKAEIWERSTKNLPKAISWDNHVVCVCKRTRRKANLSFFFA
jgi:hypothetical protein